MGSVCLLVLLAICSPELDLAGGLPFTYFVCIVVLVEVTLFTCFKCCVFLEVFVFVFVWRCRFDSLLVGCIRVCGLNG